jgi:hypothetical protein
VLGQDDALIRRLLEERGVEIPPGHPLEGQGSNASSNALRSLREDLINFACALA